METTTHIDALKRIHHAKPFGPFRIRVADGREYEVVHPEFPAFSVKDRSFVVSTSDGFFEIIDTAMVASVRVGNGAARQRGDEGPYQCGRRGLHDVVG